MTLKEWLKRNDMKPSDFAAKIGVTEQAVYCWLRGARKPCEISLFMIRAATRGQVTANDFYK